MSAGWIKLRDLRTHPKVKAVAVRLGVRRGDIIGALTGLWHDADQHAVGDLLPHLTAEVIDADAEIPGFADALVAIGWIVITPDGVTLPRYEEHNGETAKKRAEKNKRQARYRDGRRDGGAGASTGATHSRLPEKRREEEIREDKKETPNGVSSPQEKPAATDGAKVPEKFTASKIQFPEELRTPAFKSAWSEWVAHRKQLRKPLTELAVKKQLADLARAGPDVAVKSIHEAIRSGWAGLFPEKVNGNNKRTERTREPWENLRETSAPEGPRTF